MSGTSPYELGRTIGAVVGVLLPLAVLANAARRLKDPEYSRKCALGMSLVSGGWLLCALTSAATRVAGGGTTANMIAVLAALPMIAIGTVLAVLGWIDTTSTKRRGAGLAGWALVLSAVFGIAFLVGVAQGISTTKAAESLPADWKLPPSGAGTILPFPREGFSFSAPPAAWERINPKRVNDLARLAYFHSTKQLFFLLIARPLTPDEEDVTDEDLVEASQEEMRTADPAATFGETEDATAGEAQGLSFDTNLRVKGKSIRYRHWVHTENDHVYQLVVWTHRLEEDVAAVAQEIFDSFALNEP